MEKGNEHVLTEDQAIANKAWMLFNSSLNQGMQWEDAIVDALMSAEKLKLEYDQNFEPDENDPLKSEAIWNRSMNQFDKLSATIRAI